MFFLEKKGSLLDEIFDKGYQLPYREQFSDNMVYMPVLQKHPVQTLYRKGGGGDEDEEDDRKRGNKGRPEFSQIETYFPSRIKENPDLYRLLSDVFKGLVDYVLMDNVGHEQLINLIESIYNFLAGIVSRNTKLFNYFRFFFFMTLEKIFDKNSDPLEESTFVINEDMIESDVGISDLMVLDATRVRHNLSVFLPEISDLWFEGLSNKINIATYFLRFISEVFFMLYEGRLIFTYNEIIDSISVGDIKRDTVLFHFLDKSFKAAKKEKNDVKDMREQQNRTDCSTSYCREGISSTRVERFFNTYLTSRDLSSNTTALVIQILSEYLTEEELLEIISLSGLHTNIYLESPVERLNSFFTDYICEFRLCNFGFFVENLLKVWGAGANDKINQIIREFHELNRNL